MHEFFIFLALNSWTIHSLGVLLFQEFVHACGIPFAQLRILLKPLSQKAQSVLSHQAVVGHVRWPSFKRYIHFVVVVNQFHRIVPDVQNLSVTSGQAYAVASVSIFYLPHGF